MLIVCCYLYHIFSCSVAAPEQQVAASNYGHGYGHGHGHGHGGGMHNFFFKPDSNGNLKNT